MFVLHHHWLSGWPCERDRDLLPKFWFFRRQFHLLANGGRRRNKSVGRNEEEFLFRIKKFQINVKRAERNGKDDFCRVNWKFLQNQIQAATLLHGILLLDSLNLTTWTIETILGMKCSPTCSGLWRTRWLWFVVFFFSDGRGRSVGVALPRLLQWSRSLSSLSFVCPSILLPNYSPPRIVRVQFSFGRREDIASPPRRSFQLNVQL